MGITSGAKYDVSGSGRGPDIIPLIVETSIQQPIETSIDWCVTCKEGAGIRRGSSASVDYLQKERTIHATKRTHCEVHRST